jgi:putative superfamily III holin-X
MALQSVKDPTTESKTGSRFGAKPSFASLLHGLVQDLKNLIAQEIRLARHEFQHEVQKVKTAALSMSAGIALATVGGLLLILMLVHLLQALTGLPLWACYGIVGGIFVGGGVFMLMKGKNTASDIHVVPPKTVQTMKENMTWIKDQTQSHKI